METTLELKKLTMICTARKSEKKALRSARQNLIRRMPNETEKT